MNNLRFKSCLESDPKIHEPVVRLKTPTFTMRSFWTVALMVLAIIIDCATACNECDYLCNQGLLFYCSCGECVSGAKEPKESIDIVNDSKNFDDENNNNYHYIDMIFMIMSLLGILAGIILAMYNSYAMCCRKSSHINTKQIEVDQVDDIIVP